MSASQPISPQTNFTMPPAMSNDIRLTLEQSQYTLTRSPPFLRSVFSFLLFSLYFYYYTLRYNYYTLLYITIQYSWTQHQLLTNHSNSALAHYICCRHLLFISSPPKTHNNDKYFICRQNLLHMVRHNRDIRKKKKVAETDGRRMGNAAMMKEREDFRLVPRPLDRNVVRSKWTYLCT